MKQKLSIIFILVLILAACGNSNDATSSKAITLLDQNKNEVSFPSTKPSLFFYITTYTWGLCQKQLVELHKNLDQLNDLDVETYIVSIDSPEDQLQLYNAIEKEFGKSLTFVSDPNLVLIEETGMKNEDAAFRGYALMDTEGNTVFHTINDYWGEEFDKTIAEVKKEYEKLEK